MIDNLRATKVKKKDFDKEKKENLPDSVFIKELFDNIFILEKNTPKQIDKGNHSHIACIHELKPKETPPVNEALLVSSVFNDNAFAMIGNEFCLNFLKDSQKVDLTYYYFSTGKEVTIYLYDMKKTFTEVDMILKLVDQWNSSARTAKFCIDELEDYNIKSIKIGVITENNDIARREKAIYEVISEKEVPTDVSKKMPSSAISKHKASMAYDIKKKQILTHILNGTAPILGDTYPYDIRIFDEENVHHMRFIDGKLADDETT